MEQNADTLAEAQKVYSRKVNGSNNQERERVNKKTDWKLAIDLCRKFDILFFEDLNLRAMKALWGGIAFVVRKLKHQLIQRQSLAVD